MTPTPTDPLAKMEILLRRNIASLRRSLKLVPRVVVATRSVMAVIDCAADSCPLPEERRGLSLTSIASATYERLTDGKADSTVSALHDLLTISEMAEGLRDLTKTIGH